MAFLEEVFNCFGKGEWQVQLTYPKGLAISGYKKIVELTNNRIELSLPQKKKLIVCGEALSILTLAESEIYLRGAITSMEIV